MTETNPISYNTYEKMTHKEQKEKSKHIWQKGKDQTYMWYVYKKNKEERKENTS